MTRMLKGFTLRQTQIVAYSHISEYNEFSHICVWIWIMLMVKWGYLWDRAENNSNIIADYRKEDWPGWISSCTDPDGLQDSAGSELLHRSSGVKPAITESHFKSFCFKFTTKIHLMMNFLPTLSFSLAWLTPHREMSTASVCFQLTNQNSLAVSRVFKHVTVPCHLI